MFLKGDVVYLVNGFAFHALDLIGKLVDDVPELVKGPQLPFELAEHRKDRYLLGECLLSFVDVFQLSRIAFQKQVVSVGKYVVFVVVGQTRKTPNSLYLISHFLHPSHDCLPLLINLVDHFLL